jgi:hypothetical protein
MELREEYDPDDSCAVVCPGLDQLAVAVAAVAAVVVFDTPFSQLSFVLARLERLTRLEVP